MLKITVNQNNVYKEKIDQQGFSNNWQVSRVILKQDWTQVRLSVLIYLVEHFVWVKVSYVFD